MEIDIQIDLRRGGFEAMHPNARLFNFDSEKMVYFGEGSEGINSQWTTWCACIGMLHLETGEAKAQAVPECKWSKNQGGFYDTSCINAFVFPESDDTPEYHEFTHCPFCGGKLSEPQEAK
ncbi:hypothetical protein [Escherichia phage vB_EcoM_APEC]|nr:hypothetical protein [Escherichia phage vB_EcoM_APEC]